MRRFLVILLMWGCSEGGTVVSDPITPTGPVWITNIEQPLPVWISQTGIYADPAQQVPADVFIGYEPTAPLYSNGASKDRYLYLPPDTQIDTTDPDAWAFPVGTVLVKTFRYEDIEGRDGDVQIETRLVFKRAGGWDYAEYHWNVEGTQARLLEGNWIEQALALTDQDGKAFSYTLPGRLDCRGCHETHAGNPVLGIDPYNIDPALIDSSVFDAAPTERARPGRTPEEQAAMAYLVGNCVHCHHGEGGGDNASFSLRPEDLVANTVGQPTASSASGDGIRIVAGKPDESAIFEAVVKARVEDYRGDFKPMPPAGIDRIDPDADAVLRAWIEGL